MYVTAICSFNAILNLEELGLPLATAVVCLMCRGFMHDSTHTSINNYKYNLHGRMNKQWKHEVDASS